MNYILFDDQASRTNLLPLTFVRPVADIRSGILTIREKWEKWLKEKTSTLTEDYLSVKYPLVKEKNNILINGSVYPTKVLASQVAALQPNECLISRDTIVALHLRDDDIERIDEIEGIREVEASTEVEKLNETWELFMKNDDQIARDFELLTQRRKSQEISGHNTVVGGRNIFVEKGARVEGAILNGNTGCIYIGRDAEVMEGAVIRGPLALCEHSVVKMSAKIYGPVTVGPYSKVGGEIIRSVILGYSNKAHDGFLGHSVIAEWCNLGADTNVSNLKNSYDAVKLWNYGQKSFVDTGLQFCGLIMGDHSKCGINTMFNTGTVVGVNANIFGAGYQRNFIPSFTWGGPHGMKLYDIKKALQVMKIVYARRELELTDVDRAILRHVYEITFDNRKFL